MTGLSPGAQNLSWLSDFRFFIGTYSWQAELRDIRDCRKINDILERRSTEIRRLYEECQDSCKFHFQILFFLQQVCCVFSCKISVQPHTIIMHVCFDKWLFWVFTLAFHISYIHMYRNLHCFFSSPHREGFFYFSHHEEHETRDVAIPFLMVVKNKYRWFENQIWLIPKKHTLHLV